MKKSNLILLSQKFKVPGIVSDYTTCSEYKLYAVRSCDSSEDTSEKSNAGKFDSFLFVEQANLKDTVDMVLKKADNYFIQEMVINPNFSAVVFKDKNTTTINVNNGLCEPITAGHVTGTVYLFKEDSIFKKYGVQLKTLIYEDNELKLINDTEPEFNKEHIVELNKLAGEIMEYMEMESVDLEISYKDGIFYILQCRPWNSKR